MPEVLLGAVHVAPRGVHVKLVGERRAQLLLHNVAADARHRLFDAVEQFLDDAFLVMLVGAGVVVAVFSKLLKRFEIKKRNDFEAMVAAVKARRVLEGGAADE